ncbi:hypothetical protein [Mycoplasma sp. 'Moose RK']|uniref:hypothetical protein n=1 Tax=Mycoplasma sp. 'Moose RK' TaxID=2780095 RepID=UPI00280B6F04|nr:hypothetical protein [Mycoplasma sp. 'Moose RK']
MANFDYNKYYNFACQRKLYWRYFESQNWYKSDQIIENIIKSMNLSSWLTDGYLPRYYSHIILQVFLFNAENSELKINQKNWKYFLIFYFIFTTIHFIFTWYWLWLFYVYYHEGELNENLYKNLFDDNVVWVIPLGFVFIGFNLIPTLYYYPKRWVTFWLFES